MAGMMGGGGSVSSVLDNMASLAAVLADPKKLQALRDELSTAEKNAKDAQAIANSRLDAAAKAEKENASKFSQRKIELEALEQALSGREMVVKQNEGKIKSQADALTVAQNKFSADQRALLVAQNAHNEAVSNAATRQANVERDAMTRINAAQAALDKKATDLKTKEGDLEKATKAHLEAKASFEARQKALSQALAGVA